MYFTRFECSFSSVVSDSPEEKYARLKQRQKHQRIIESHRQALQEQSRERLGSSSEGGTSLADSFIVEDDHDESEENSESGEDEFNHRAFDYERELELSIRRPTFGGGGFIISL